MNHEAQLKALLAQDRVRVQVLRTVRGLELPDCWVAAGFVRSLVWDHLHQRNADAPYHSATDAMTCWPETATAVGVRLGGDDEIEVAAPLGLDDLFSLVVRPTGRFRTEKYALFLDRVQSKRWQEIWPELIVVTA
ncbi:nucleotidyltransferase family protein [Pseudomonas sp. RIT-PI-r]|uniref:nucleotidyltransferase family protein n=1 Tax=Pseudomonas sp. RIT-PI-r TaxID=1699620 RepID=UPI0006D6BB92|nr:nucleotidyltransferase family protein [Pseudomonas sp. RIT-PI-r]KPG96603.1 hypothetical protein AK821_14960 [Pseudomonas sp. RIT-PI-r]